MPLAKRRVLCVDDTEDTIIMLTHLLELEGFDVSTIMNVESALELSGRSSFDLYILDNWLPGESGIALCKRIREFDQITPVIIYSSVVSPGEMVRAIEAGATAFVPKPYVDELIDAIRRLPQTFQA